MPRYKVQLTDDSGRREYLRLTSPSAPEAEAECIRQFPGFQIVDISRDERPPFREEVSEDHNSEWLDLLDGTR
jgi:hypothetical protein